MGTTRAECAEEEGGTGGLDDTMHGVRLRWKRRREDESVKVRRICTIARHPFSFGNPSFFLRREAGEGGRRGNVASTKGADPKRRGILV